MRARPRYGVVSAGHPLTARAGLEVLEAGGNAFDAAVAASLASCVVEPALTSLGGGGFLLAAPAGARPGLFDFFVQTPRLKRALGPSAEGETPEGIDFRTVTVRFGGADQDFHIGLGAAGVPGLPAGLWRVHAALGRLPMTEVAAPAIALAREGHRITAFQAWCMRALEGILLDGPAGRALYAHRGEDGRPALRPQGALLQFGRTADLLDYLARCGPEEFYRGEVAAAVARDCAQRGGYLTEADFRGYAVIERPVLALRYRDHDVWTNPAPSAGGTLLALQLALLEAGGPHFGAFGSRAWLRRMVATQDLVNRARRVDVDPVRHDPARAASVLSADGLRPWAERLHAAGFRPDADRLGTTTHLSVVDAAGNAAAVTTSVGQGCGYLIPGTDVMLNNMLGEADLNPDGFHQWTPDRRIASMMSPTVVARDGQVRLVLGTGGANRIRTALAAVLHGVLDAGALAGAGTWPSAEGDPEALLRAAVDAPRLHLSDGEGAALDLEGGFDPDAYRGLDEGAAWRLRPWTERNMDFGGVHAIARTPGGTWGVADERRAGAVAAG